MVEVASLRVNPNVKAIINQTPTDQEIILERTYTDNAKTKIVFTGVEWEVLVNWVKEKQA